MKTITMNDADLIALHDCMNRLPREPRRLVRQQVHSLRRNDGDLLVELDQTAIELMLPAAVKLHAEFADLLAFHR